ncbi:Dexh-box atp-dependent rna helicase dexh9 [Thalictrum thalictroides]|uniref:Dexh-box atp-dependent rna helicase dexh9 n=1 Tax=Thalictrum thalictroides TaxID=46969 RepID=A0A7J6UTH1_THATH|nr:Dexh-box atp-dependent rna helicase dexh9 [Thalictrum thalictroides]
MLMSGIISIADTLQDDVVELKGKVACEISSADELTLMELMFNGVLKDVNVEEMVSLLSCFVWEEKLQDHYFPLGERTQHGELLKFSSRAM